MRSRLSLPYSLHALTISKNDDDDHEDDHADVHDCDDDKPFAIACNGVALGEASKQFLVTALLQMI